MNWGKPKANLNILSGQFEYVGRMSSGAKNKNHWSKIRKETIDKAESSCRYCGGKYIKYMMCFHLNENPLDLRQENMDMACKFCYMITHINFGFSNEMMLCKSKLSQKEIVHQTVNYIIDKKYMPTPKEIDCNAILVPLSIMELCSIVIENGGVMPNVLSKFKIFFTKNTDIIFVDNFVGKKVSMFVEYDDCDNDDDSDCDESIAKFNNDAKYHDNKWKKKLKVHKFKQQERECLNKLLDTNNDKLAMVNMENKLAFVEQLNAKTSKLYKISDAPQFNQECPSSHSTI
jgi:hypothetical protein